MGQTGVNEPTKRTWDVMTRQEQREVLDWLVTSCVVFGTELSTAYKVAAAFAKGME